MVFLYSAPACKAFLARAFQAPACKAFQSGGSWLGLTSDWSSLTVAAESVAVATRAVAAAAFCLWRLDCPSCLLRSCLFLPVAGASLSVRRGRSAGLTEEFPDAAADPATPAAAAEPAAAAGPAAGPPAAADPVATPAAASEKKLHGRVRLPPDFAAGSISKTVFVVVVAVLCFGSCTPRIDVGSANLEQDEQLLMQLPPCPPNK